MTGPLVIGLYELLVEVLGLGLHSVVQFAVFCNLLVRGCELGDIEVCRLNALFNLVKGAHAHVIVVRDYHRTIVVFLNAVYLTLARAHGLREYLRFRYSSLDFVEIGWG